MTLLLILKNFLLHYGDMTDSLNIINLIKSIKPSEIYNLAAQSHVQVSLKYQNIHQIQCYWHT